MVPGSDHDAAPTPPSDFDRDLERAAGGEEAARQRLWSEHYGALRELVVAWFSNKWRDREVRGDLSIGATHIVNVLYERLAVRSAAYGQGRAWFFECFYTECVRIFLDHLKKRRRHHDRRAELCSVALFGDGRPADIDSVQEILDELEKHDALGVRIAWMKLIEPQGDEGDPTGPRSLTNQMIADRLGCSLRQVEKRWSFAKAHLLTRLADR